jgi:hypothetical protein
MNQGIAFARTIRALDADDFRGSKLGLILAALALACWTWWMFAARIPQYAAATSVHFDSADFPLETANRIHPGQPATLQLDDAVIHTEVLAVSIADHGVRVEFKQSPSFGAKIAAASIEVDRLSPASIALRAIGRGNR